MRKLILLLAVLSLVVMALAPKAARADMIDKSGNAVVNAALGWMDCPKAIADEFGKARSRWYVGALVTAPTMCAANAGYRYIGVVADVLTLPWDGNIVQPGALSKHPPLRLP